MIVDDEEDVQAIAFLGLEMGAGWNVLTVCSSREALNVAAHHKPDVILVDMIMPDTELAWSGVIARDREQRTGNRVESRLMSEFYVQFMS